MKNPARDFLRYLLVVASLVAGACAGEAPLNPTSPSQNAVPAVAVPGDHIEASAAVTGRRALDLTGCPKLQAPGGSQLTFIAYATGVQIYRWSGTSWVFVEPSAVLSADAGGHSIVGRHYAGPTWESNSGSTVVGTVLERCTVSASAIPWLSLSAVSADGPGVFSGVTFIQRVNTVGGTASTNAGTFVGELVSVPYTAEYYFYR